ncbi:MAG: N-glycanase [Flavobacteriaceae bacterium]|nr:MAG: N-glycanase [Flavobacteriaceae bacterium]
MNKYIQVISVVVFSVASLFAQEPTTHVVFNNQPLNFNGDKGTDTETVRLQAGRVIYKKVSMPTFKKGTDVWVNLTVRSNGDRWDKSGSCFVITDPSKISILDVSEKKASFPEAAAIETKFRGVLATDTYTPALEIMRFMTPFGVGHYSSDTGKHRKPVYIPVWEKEVKWQHDISDLVSVVSGDFYVGVWIDSWTAEGYAVDLSFTYSNRPKKKVKVMPLLNNVPYVGGQDIPDFFARTDVDYSFDLPENAKNVKLNYITTGHGGHEGGDEFIKIKNSVYFNQKLVIDTIPWRDDCASFRRFNPTSGVWLKKDTASYIDFKAGKYMKKEIEERIASSDLSRSNWCPGSSVNPFIAKLGDLKKGTHHIKISIPATAAFDDKLNHWLVSAYLTYEE